MRHLLFLSLVFCLAQDAVQASSPTSPCDRGMLFFNAKKYNLAIYHLKGALRLDPDNALGHYYLASAFVHVGRHPEAISEYRLSYELDPRGSVSGFCRQALLTYNVALPILEKTPAIEGVVEPVAESNVDHVKSAASATIRRQAEDEKARKKKFVDKLTDNIVKTGEAKARLIKTDADEKIKEIFEGPSVLDPRLAGTPVSQLSPVLQEHAKDSADAIRRDADDRAQLEMARANEHSSQYKQWYLDKESDLDSTATNLESQFEKTGTRSSVKLNPFGTGLYVRNYSTLRPKHPLPEARQGVVRLVDQGFHEVEKEEAPAERAPEREVKGVVLD